MLLLSGLGYQKGERISFHFTVDWIAYIYFSLVYQQYCSSFVQCCSQRLQLVGFILSQDKLLLKFTLIVWKIILSLLFRCPEGAHWIFILRGFSFDDLTVLFSMCVGNKLVELQIRNAWLSVDGLKPMPTLSKLTLEYIRLDDEDLNKMNVSFPGLQVLNLMGVGGLKEPKIHLLQLKSCKWTVSNAVYSVAIVAPNLVKLSLKCVRPRLLLIETPSLADLHLSIEEASNFKVQEFVNLTNLHLESLDLHRLLCSLPFGKTIKNLKLGLTKPAELMGVAKFGFEFLFSVFPNVSSLSLTPWAWSVLEMYLCPEDDEVRTRMKGLKEITAYLEIHDFETTLSFIFSILDNCFNLSEMKLFIHRDVVFHVTNTLISRCMARCPRVTWRWGMWKEGTKDAWIPDGI